MQPMQIGPIAWESLIGGVLLVVVAVWTSRVAVRSTSRLVSMVRTSTTPIEAIDSGPVEIEGVVRSAGETLSGGPEEAVITEHRSQTRDRGDETDFSLPPLPQSLTPNALNKTASVPFYVEDDTGRVLVDPVKADVSLSTDEKDTQRRGPDRRKKTVKARLEPGDEVYVFGQAIPSENYSPPEKSGLLYRLFRLFGSDYEQVPASDVIEDEAILITRDGDDSNFIISDTSEWRGWIRQALMALLWIAVTVALVALGVNYISTGTASASVPMPVGALSAFV